MAKKKTKKSSPSKKYNSFKLHGEYENQKVFFYVVADLAIGFVLGFMLQPTIAAALTSYASSGY